MATTQIRKTSNSLVFINDGILYKDFANINEITLNKKWVEVEF